MAGQGNNDWKAPKPTVEKPVKGQLEKTNHALRGGIVGYWQWDGEQWLKITKALYKTGGLPGLKTGVGEQSLSSMLIGPIGPDKVPSNSTLRWPKDAIHPETEYVF